MLSRKRICDNNKIANCYNLVSFDEDTDTYYAKKITDYSTQESALHVIEMVN